MGFTKYFLTVLFLPVAFSALSFPSLFPKAPQLGTYNVDPLTITTSGISSGGAMATQFHFIYSSEIKGVGIFAGGPYTCAYPGGMAAGMVCMTTPGQIDDNKLITTTNAFSTSGKIDSVGNVTGSRVYIFHGSNDGTVAPASGRKIESTYNHYGALVHGEFTIPAGHGQPVDGNGYGGPCERLNIDKQFINECGYNGAYEMFSWLYGINVVRPPMGFVANGTLSEFDQSPFITPGASMAAKGLLYVPNKCKDGSVKCKLHIAFHGCTSNQFFVGTGYAVKSQYLETAELNNIIIVFPQTSIVLNTAGCWDWFDYTSPARDTYATKNGAQPTAVHNMMKRVLGSA